MFDYDVETRAGFEVISSISKEGYSIYDVNYESLFNRRIPAFLFIPNKGGPFPAVIFMHPSQGNRKTFFHEAKLLATKGYISLLIEAPLFGRNSQPDDLDRKKFTKKIEALADIQEYIHTIMDIRMGVTLLSKLTIVDEARIAFVGHGFGAACGGVISGIDSLIKTFVLISGYGEASEWQLTSEHPIAAIIRSFLPPERFEYFISSLRKLDAIHYVKNAAPASLLFQFAKNDEFIEHGHAATFYSAASSPKKIIWYDTDHLFTNCKAALLDRQEWLSAHFCTQNDTFSKESTKN
ncbi:dienelactone hydrolase family protein [Bacillus sp. ISL-40]|uniref:alpha/beta hydrolase n=1 Tax=unclassified Bacillus (in: firmicutes) TaxID=185979 RepID=UPI001BEC61DA|nr:MULTISPECIES: dienelactone hydrolase family protein [unclassified Bacillus (in: firmicutes)]MBT2699660.1 dienelactone hydrolase family protein [Bacillus sp. ISL-40]MBT2723570.1 dienelactone hydrolase family protein [Bacillus sp. ISL-46]MBT2739641.1 dienelactone hydrolase family protein [Bacillus sp. ISL-77]